MDKSPMPDISGKKKKTGMVFKRKKDGTKKKSKSRTRSKDGAMQKGVVFKPFMA